MPVRSPDDGFHVVQTKHEYNMVYSSKTRDGKEIVISYESQDSENGPFSCFTKAFKPLHSRWFNKRFGLSPSKSITSRRPCSDGSPGDPRERPDIFNYDKIVENCKKSGTLWEDPDFPANDESVFYSRQSTQPWVWKRPHKLCQNPEFISEGFSRFDVRQGELGDCWLLAAVANLTLVPEIFHQCVPPDQSFSENYQGVFQFKFWHYGHWIDVMVDDRLPTYNGKLVFMHSSDTKEFWSALLEKAYAKLAGSYEGLKGGSTSEAMEDFTGGLSEMFDLKESLPPDLFNIMLEALERCSLMGCSLEANPQVNEQELPNGLIRGHAYSITGVKKVTVTLPSGKTGKMQLLRIRNPWGNECEWKGAWSDSSQEWSCISAAERKEIGLTFEADGENWMSFQDFKANFEKLELCNLDPETAEKLNKLTKNPWAASSFEGNWVRGATAGGCRNNLDTFALNPQYRITLADPAEDGKGDGKCTCMIALMQKHRRRMKKDGCGDLLFLGYSLYKVEADQPADEPLDREYFRTHVSTARSTFMNLREVTTRFRLPVGDYVIIPSTFSPGEEGEFMIRVFSEAKANMKQVEEHTGYTPVAMPVEAKDDGTEKLNSFFDKLAGQDLEIDAWELQKVLSFALKKEFEFEEFSLDTCRSMIACMDLSRSGKLELEEFKELWQSVRLWKAVFKKIDTNNSGSINSYQLKKALRESGYHLNSRVYTALVLRYASRDGTLSFDNFMGCAVKLKTMIDVYNERDPRKRGEAKFDMDAWIELSMYA